MDKLIKVIDLPFGKIDNLSDLTINHILYLADTTGIAYYMLCSYRQTTPMSL